MQNLKCACGLCATSWFLPYFDIICDLLLNRRITKWDLFVKLFLEAIFYLFIVLLCDKHACTKSENFLSNLVKGSRIYCQLTCITPVSHACGSKTPITCIQDNFRRSITINLKIDQKGYLAKTCGISARSPDTLPL